MNTTDEMLGFTRLSHVGHAVTQEALQQYHAHACGSIASIHPCSIRTKRAVRYALLVFNVYSALIP